LLHIFKHSIFKGQLHLTGSLISRKSTSFSRRWVFKRWKL